MNLSLETDTYSFNLTLIFVILRFIFLILTLLLLLLKTVLDSDERLEIFAPYVGQVLHLRYYAKKGTRVGIGFNRSEKIVGFPEVLVLEVAFGIKDDGFGYTFTIAGQHEGRPDFRTFSNCCRILEFPFHNWEILMPDKSYVPLNFFVIEKSAPKRRMDHYESLVPIDNIPNFFRLYHVYNHWDAGINFINSKLTEHQNLYQQNGTGKGRK